MPLAVRLLDGLEAMIQGRDPRRFRVGLALPMSGVLGLSGPSALDAALLAGTEISGARTSSDRPLDLVLIDSGAAPGAVAASVAALACEHIVDGFVGLHTSDTLEAVEQALAPYRTPYVFTPGHEDARRLPGFLCSGESPVQSMTGLARVIQERGIRDWAIVGTDYVWPRAMRAAARSVIEAADGRVVLDRLLPLGSVRSSINAIIDELTHSPARGIVVNMPGRDLTSVLLALRARGLDRRLVRFSGSLEENTLYALDGDRSGNLYANQHSFESLPSARRQELNERYRSAFGDESPVLNSWAEHCYDGAHLLDRLDRAGLLDPASLGPQGDRQTPPEALRLRPDYDAHNAVAAGMAFEVL
jgi:ABC-type branched-subunit amino acid transport system substrate-binding protein